MENVWAKKKIMVYFVWEHSIIFFTHPCLRETPYKNMAIGKSNWDACLNISVACSSLPASWNLMPWCTSLSASPSGCIDSFLLDRAFLMPFSTLFRGAPAKGDGNMAWGWSVFGEGVLGEHVKGDNPLGELALCEEPGVLRPPGVGNGWFCMDEVRVGVNKVLLGDEDERIGVGGITNGVKGGFGNLVFVDFDVERLSDITG